MATGPNTATTYYLDSNAKAKCATELRLIERKCKPEPPDNNGKRRKRSGLGGKLSDMTEAFDSIGKGNKPPLGTNYRRDRSTTAMSGNAWMDDHCSGLWVSPPNARELPDNMADVQQQLRELTEKLDVGMLDKVGMLGDALGEVADVAREVIPVEKVNDIMESMALKSGAKGVVGLLGIKTVLVPIAMGAWTAYDMYNTASELATLAGPKGQAAFDAFNSIYDIGDEVKGIVNQLQTEPGKALTNAMALLAKLDPCIRARKCLLVKYKDTKGSPKAAAQARHGRGCCPGQTGHHVLPRSMVEGNCPGYDNDEAPVMCLEGTSNNEGWGSHGNAHGALGRRMNSYRSRRAEAGQSPNTIPYEDAKEESVGAVRDVAAKQCDPECLKAQLDNYYKNMCGGKDLTPNDGTRGFSPQPEPGAVPNTSER